MAQSEEGSAGRKGASSQADGLAARIGRFARERIRGHDDLRQPGNLSRDLWQDMAAEGFLGLGAPTGCGGLGAVPAVQVAAAEALARGGRNLGLTVAWQGHNALTRFFFDRFGSPEQRRRWLPELAAGRVSPAVAISEPGAGAHPKHLRTEARPENGGWILNGQKAYVTNGAMAGVYVLLAITEVSAGRKRYTAFLLPRETPGLTLNDSGALDALHPVTHCGLRLEGCRLGADAVLGAPGTAYETMAGPLRDHEDLLQVGTLVGGMLAVLGLLGEEAARGALTLSDEDIEIVGMMAARAASVRALGRAALEAAEQGESGTALLLAGRRLLADFLADLDRLPLGPGLPQVLADLRRDLGVLGGIARQAARLRLRRLGEAALRGLD